MLTLDNFHKVCRACLSSKESFKYQLFDNVSPQIFEFCTTLQIQNEDPLPKSICSLCYKLLAKFNDFKHKCIKSEKVLLSFTEIKSEGDIKHEPTDIIICETKIENLERRNVIVLDEFKLETELSDSDDNDKVDDFNEEYIPIKYKRSKKESKIYSEPKLKREVKLKRPFFYSCTLCNKKFRVLERFETHKLEHEGENPSIHCNSCNKTFMTWTGLRRHKESQHTTTTFSRHKCSICENIYKNLHTLRTHMYTHNEKVLICDCCGRKFNSRFVLKQHIETHKENRQRDFACEHCGKKFYNNSALVTHVTRCHRDRRYICQICSCSFTAKYNLTKHLLIHNGVKPYKCDICQKSYSTQSFLVEHKRIHSGEKPYLCSFCAKAFISKRRLKEHLRTHTGERPYKCGVCSLAFTQRGTLKRHMRVHDNNSPPLVV